MIARIKFGYPAQEALGKVGGTPEGLAALREIFNASECPDNIERGVSSWNWPSDPLIELETDGPKLIALGIEFVVVNFKGAMPLTALLPNGTPCTVQISIPHIGLLVMDEVMVLENICTDELQRHLNDEIYHFDSPEPTWVRVLLCSKHRDPRDDARRRHQLTTRSRV